MNEPEQSVEAQAARMFSRKVAGTPAALGISTGGFDREGRTALSNTEVMHLPFQTISAAMDAVRLIAREVDELRRAPS